MTTQDDPKTVKIAPWTIYSLVCGILGVVSPATVLGTVMRSRGTAGGGILASIGFVPLAVCAIVAGRAARGMISEQPDQYRGKGWAIAGEALGWLGASLCVLPVAVLGLSALSAALD